MCHFYVVFDLLCWNINCSTTDMVTRQFRDKNEFQLACQLANIGVVIQCVGSWLASDSISPASPASSHHEASRKTCFVRMRKKKSKLEEANVA